eukprot:jgi/Botrbrau1/3732/Bobra.0363s0017.2
MPVCLKVLSRGVMQGRDQRIRKVVQQGYTPLPARPSSPPNARPLNTRRISPGPDVVKRPEIKRTLAPGQPVPVHRQKDKVVALPDLPEELGDRQNSLTYETTPAIFEDLVEVGGVEAPGLRGRITIYCIAETLDRTLLQRKLEERGGKFLLERYPDVVYGQYHAAGAEAKGDIFYFDYGCVAMWGLTQKEEQDVLRNVVVPCQENPLPPRDVEVDEFQFHYTASERPNISNDTITINHRFAQDHLIKLSISHALSQSTKLCVFEERVMQIVQSTKDLPELLASTGKVKMSRKEIAQLLGKVFIQRSAVNLLSTVLDTPEFFWSAPDSMQSIYKKVCEYMELDDRVEVLNNRYQVLQEMLNLLRDQQNNYHTTRLEWIVIILIVVEVIVGLFECASILGWVGSEHHGPALR